MPARTAGMMLKLLVLALLLFAAVDMLADEQYGAANAAPRPEQFRAMVGAYYFDGWAGTSGRWQEDPAWTALHPPTHLTMRMIAEFADREPVWG